MSPATALAQSIGVPVTVHGLVHSAGRHAGSPVRQLQMVLPSSPLALVNVHVAFPVVSGMVAIVPRCDCGSVLVQKVGKLEHEPITVPMAMLRIERTEPFGPA